MERNIEEGTSLSLEKTVTQEDTASYYGSGLVPVFATPAMVALMENTAMNLVLPYLPPGYNTVGTGIYVKHTKATAVGKKVSCTATLIRVEGKKLDFAVTVNDEEGQVGDGTHTRYIINTGEFLKRLNKE